MLPCFVCSRQRLLGSLGFAPPRDALEDAEPDKMFGEKLPNDELVKFAFLGFTFKHRPQSPTMARLVNSFS